MMHWGERNTAEAHLRDPAFLKHILFRPGAALREPWSDEQGGMCGG